MLLLHYTYRAMSLMPRVQSFEPVRTAKKRRLDRGPAMYTLRIHTAKAMHH